MFGAQYRLKIRRPERKNACETFFSYLFLFVVVVCNNLAVSERLSVMYPVCDADQYDSILHHFYDDLRRFYTIRRRFVRFRSKKCVMRKMFRFVGVHFVRDIPLREVPCLF